MFYYKYVRYVSYLPASHIHTLFSQCIQLQREDIKVLVVILYVVSTKLQFAIEIQSVF